MGRIGDDDIERVRSATDLVQLVGERIQLSQRGRLFWGCCPFHNEKTPSFKVDPALQLYHCFGCGKSGNVFGFVMEADNMDFPDAVRALAERAHIEIKEEGGKSLPHGYRERLKALVQEAASFYNFTLMRSKSQEASQAREYLSGRGFGADVCKRWGLGFAPGRGSLVRHLSKAGFNRQEIIDSNMAFVLSSGPRKGQVADRFYDRVIFPINDAQGKAIAFGGRIIEKRQDVAKYINTSDTPIFSKRRNLFAFDKAKPAITSTGCAVVVEGYTDVIALHEAGIDNVVATLGTALTPEHIKTLRTARPKSIVYMFDGDDAGQNAADRAAQLIDPTATSGAGKDYVSLQVAVIPGGKDPAEYVSEFGAEAMRSVMADTKPLLRFAVDRHLAKWDLSNPETRQRALMDVAELLAPLKNTVEHGYYISYVADRLQTTESTARQAFMGARPAAQAASRVSAIDNATAGAAGSFARGGSTGPAPRSTERASREGGSQSAQDAQGPQSAQGQQAELPVATAQQALERDLIALAVNNPHAKDAICAGFEGVPWSSPKIAYLASLVAERGSGEDAGALARRLSREVDGVERYLSGSMESEMEDQAAASEARRIALNLKEADLLERIRLGNYRLKMGEYDGDLMDNQLFEDVAKLQRELAELRKASSQ